MVIDGRDRIQEIGYKIDKDSPDLPLYEALAQLVHNCFIYNINAIGWEEFDQFFQDDQDYINYRENPKRPLITTSLQLFYQALRKFEGNIPPLAQVSPLVCRCFGVFQQDIIDHIHAHPNCDLKTLTGDILAGGGCTRCMDDLDEYIDQYTLPEAPFVSGRAQRVLETYYLFCEWRNSENMDLDILDILDNTVIVTPLGKTTENDITSFEKFLKQKPSSTLKNLKISTNH